MAPVLGYWNIRGVAEPIRYLLHYIQTDFEDKRYEFGPEPNYYDSEWSRNDKKNLGLQLAYMPYYIDGDLKITQSIVIMRYLARKNKLYFPKEDNGPDHVRFQSMEEHARDLEMNLAFIAYNPEFDSMKEHFSWGFKDRIKMAADFLGNNVWLFGDEISHVDFVLFEALDVIKYCFPDCCDPHPNLVKFMERFAALPGVNEYRESSLKWPVFAPYAKWGGKGEAPL